MVGCGAVDARKKAGDAVAVGDVAAEGWAQGDGVGVAERAGLGVSVEQGGLGAAMGRGKIMKVSIGVLRHPKFLDLKERIGAEALEYLVRLWGHCEEDQRGGTWRGADGRYVERVLDWRGKRGKLWRALLECRWVHESEGGVVVHDWDAMNWRAVVNWRVGANGGRPKKTNVGAGEKPNGNPRVNPGDMPTVNRRGNRVDGVGETPLNEGMNEGVKGGTRAHARVEPPPGEGSVFEVPSEEEVLGFAREWPGAPAWGAPPGIPEGWAIGWLAAQVGRGAARFPSDWRRVMVLRYRQDFGAGRVAIGNSVGGARGAVSASVARMDLVREVEALGQAVAEHVAVVAADPSPEELEDLRLKKKRLKELEGELGVVR